MGFMRVFLEEKNRLVALWSEYKTRKSYGKGKWTQQRQACGTDCRDAPALGNVCPNKPGDPGVQDLYLACWGLGMTQTISVSHKGQATVCEGKTIRVRNWHLLNNHGKITWTSRANQPSTIHLLHLWVL